ncbi:MAG: PilW family protein [Acidobacteriota bacterium]
MRGTKDVGRTARSGRATEAGYTLLEAIVAVSLLLMVLAGVLTLFDFNNKIAKAQVNVAEMQQSLRVAQAGMIRNVRMAGRGGLPVFRQASAGGYAGMLLPEGPAVGVANNVDAGVKIGGDDDAVVVEGTDVLTVRGVLSTPMYQLNPAGGGNIQGAEAAGEGELVINAKSPTGVPQDLQALKDAVDSGLPEALLLVSAASDRIQAVVELIGGNVTDEQATLNFRITGGTHTEEYLDLSPQGAFPPNLRTVTAVGILEEYRYYVRDVDPAPRLSRARLYPGTGTAYADDASNLRADIADNILDLQVALGVDRNADEVVTDNEDDADDWLFNAAGDSPADTAVWNQPGQPLYYVRISTLARTDRLDPRYVSPPIAAIEDRVYDEPETPAQADRLDRSYRRRLLQTVVDLRNLT